MSGSADYHKFILNCQCFPLWGGERSRQAIPDQNLSEIDYWRILQCHRQWLTLQLKYIKLRKLLCHNFADRIVPPCKEPGRWGNTELCLYLPLRDGFMTNSFIDKRRARQKWFSTVAWPTIKWSSLLLYMSRTNTVQLPTSYMNIPYMYYSYA